MTTPPATQVVQGEVLAERRPSLLAPVGVALLLAAVIAIVLLRALGDAPRSAESIGLGRATGPPGSPGAAVGARD
jgi:hypothetical protein